VGGVVACKIMGDLTYTDKLISFKGNYVLSSIYNGTIPKEEVSAYSTLMKGEITADEIRGTSTTWVVNRILQGSENKEFSIKLEP
jgi:hypothetical protein